MIKESTIMVERSARNLILVQFQNPLLIINIFAILSSKYCI